MIIINPNLNLVPVKLEDQEKLFGLMSEIYPAAYADFWKEDCEWYLDLCFSQKNLAKELARSSAHYFFIKFNGFKAGIFKYDFPLSPQQLEIPNAMKLHRLYLHSDLHGTGVAKALMNWLETEAKSKNLDFIWLEAMEQKQQAKIFYEKMGYQLALTYQLEFDLLKPEFRGIHIYKKKIKH